ncbi:calcium-binding protein [Aurantiacibacter poecillastricola]|uniref:calcium-binding protein n=1 Tax=Aurantiacibacter poecillastricola TaxID=3064385 RepID=UPI00273DD5E7|nr:hypothetical protein [Aurantiacibacter sp. 219JJ12-13]MDP5261659.1 hypothetical protein [Aurantiacibacter sp. 219JJ12-13]
MILGTEYRDNLEGTIGDDVIEALGGDDEIIGSSGFDTIDGGPGADTLRFLMEAMYGFADYFGPETYTLTSNRLFDEAGRVDTSFSSIEAVTFSIANPEMVVFDASAFEPASAQAPYFWHLYTSFSASSSRITGSAFRDRFAVAGTDHFIDGGDGFDFVRVRPAISSSDVIIAGNADALTITQGLSTDPLTFVSARNVERVAISSRNTASVTHKVDASGSPVAIVFNAGHFDDIFVGSDFDDLVQVDPASNDGWYDFDNLAVGTDIYTGGKGNDEYQFTQRGNLLFAGVTITDFSPGDAISYSGGNNASLATFIGTADFSGTSDEIRYHAAGGQTLLQYDANGDGVADNTLVIANGEFTIEQFDTEDYRNKLRIDNTLDGSDEADTLTGGDYAEILNGFASGDTLTGNGGDDTIDGGSNVDTAVVAGKRSAYTVTQVSVGMFEVSGPDGTDTLTNVEYLQFDDQTIRLLPGEGTGVIFNTANPSLYAAAMENIRDFDGNDLGGDGAWLRIGSADVNGDGDVDQILVNDAIGRFATVGMASDGLVYFDDYSWAGETRVVGIYIDPLVQSGDVVQGSDEDSQRRFQNDLEIENINRVLGADDYDGDGLQEVYLALTDRTAYLHLYMHADGNIRYANYQSEAQAIAYLEANGFDEATYGDWFSPGT